MERFVLGEELWSMQQGHRMRYLCLIPATRAASHPPVLLIHGFLGSAFSWRFNLPVLARERTVYAVDLLGIGYSDRPPAGTVDFSLRAIAERMLAWMSEVGLQHADVISTSHGGAVGIMMAALDSERGSGLVGRQVLVAPANPYSRGGRFRLWFFNTTAGAALLRRFGPQVPRRGDQDRVGLHHWALGRMYADPNRITLETTRGYRVPMQLPGTFDYVQAVLRSLRADLDALPPLLPAAAAWPTLLLWGDSDAVVPPASAAALAKSIKGARLAVLEGAGHLPYEETSEAFNRAVLNFLDGAA